MLSPHVTHLSGGSPLLRACVVILICCSLAHGQTKGVGSPAGTNAPARSQDSLPSPFSDGDEDKWVGVLLLAGLTAALATSPIWLPPIFLEDNFVRPAYFPGHPYAREEHRYLVPTNQAPVNPGLSW